MVDLKKIKNAPYNPRTMSKESKRALLKSMEEFEDISGIVLNQKTGNIVSGNHRWNALQDKYGKNSLELLEVSDKLFSINIKNPDGKAIPSGFIMKVVNWDIEKEKAANIAANSELLSGEFTSSLQDLLGELQKDLPESLFDGLRFDELSIDLDDLDIDLDSDDVRNKIVSDSEKRNKNLESAKGDEISEVKIILTQIKLSVPGELESEVREDLKRFLEKKHYCNDVKVL